MISLQSVIRAVNHDSFEPSGHALRRASERRIDLEGTLSVLTSNLIDAYPMHGSKLVREIRMVTVVRYGGSIVSLVWGDAYGYITLITVHHGQPHEEIVVSHDDYYYSICNAPQHAA